MLKTSMNLLILLSVAMDSVVKFPTVMTLMMTTIRLIPHLQYDLKSDCEFSAASFVSLLLDHLFFSIEPVNSNRQLTKSLVICAKTQERK